MALKELTICKFEALENWTQSVRELPMIEKMIKMDAEREKRIKCTEITNSQSTQKTRTALGVGLKP